MASRKQQDQLALFDLGPPAETKQTGVGAARQPEEVEALGRELPKEIRLGGSTWSFPGWAGLVYDRSYSPSRLAHEGLAAYARHPLLRAVGVDRTHYAPVEAVELAAYRDVVPEDFRFLVKAHEGCTLSRVPDHPRYGTLRGEENPLFLDPSYCADQVVAPFMEGMGADAGALLFQFAPQDLGTPPRFAKRLQAFLAALPRGPVYAVEVRNRELLTADYGDALASVGACHCHNVHPRMPDIRAQARLVRSDRGPMTIIRWLLGPGMTYEEAGRRYEPFNRMAAPDPTNRQAVADLAREALTAERPFLCTINNNAEGSAPLSIVELAKEILARREES
ncbi:MAG TPA: DUF72 domain-containing protein [Thermoanaerobaculia bacterium]|jgi:uncharacterized protein YecE (DUF72 family)|nr:DUF72 domain-containing protein [Thermoanaerobaculia bacterium]